MSITKLLLWAQSYWTDWECNTPSCFCQPEPFALCQHSLDHFNDICILQNIIRVVSDICLKPIRQIYCGTFIQVFFYCIKKRLLHSNNSNLSWLLNSWPDVSNITNHYYIVSISSIIPFCWRTCGMPPITVDYVLVVVSATMMRSPCYCMTQIHFHKFPN